jgi:hypothetical protein
MIQDLLDIPKKQGTIITAPVQLILFQRIGIKKSYKKQ